MNNLTRKEKELKARASALNQQLASIQRELREVGAINSGDKPVPEIARLIKSQKFSYGVEFTRRKLLRKVKNPGLTFTSQRRFATAVEAKTHGTRFGKKHGHADFIVVRVEKKANAWVNPRTGKTNPVVGL